MASHKDDIYKKIWGVQHQGITAEESQAFYSTWAPDYDKDLSTGLYNGPPMVAEALAGVLGDRKDARILDVAAGTGLVGEELQKRGFSNIDALDANKEMLDIAEAKNVYRNLIQEFLGPKRLQIEDDTYDALCTAGSFSDGHLKSDCLEEMIRIVKPDLLRLRGSTRQSDGPSRLCRQPSSQLMFNCLPTSGYRKIIIHRRLSIQNIPPLLAFILLFD
ncbi:methyltransferase-like protein 27 isoform X1 [Branchiostoma floridae x Branchiostoma japonicum]